MTGSLKDKKNIKLAEKTLSNFKLCDHCLGRFFAKIGNGLTNKERGNQLRKHLKQYETVEIDNCWLCLGLIGEIRHFADLISESVEEYEFETFLVGTKIDDDILDKEQELLNFTGSEHTESIKTELKREIGKILEGKLDKEVNFEKPTIMAVIDTSFDVVNLQIKSLFIYGRYNKYRRDIPQTRWFCRICRGKGCRKCDYTGKMYETSVEELVAKKTLDETGSSDESFHGCGREDIDALMLGNGRPFVLEIKDPKVRNLDLSQLERKINIHGKDKIKVTNLRFSDRDEIARIKAADFRKTYHVVLIGEKIINKEKLKKAAQALQDKTISQFTPSRVARRRANMVRERKIHNCNIESIDGTMATLTIEAESGTYIKELISGDDGRTRPSISEMIGVPCKVAELDVIEIKGE
ncbi:MAG: tRNA pseudouridine(54/55) synthase Pus10 [Thermoplasmatales archaeon]|nr:tRNA pseudouridine(54/55) synthase Pus10 [Thermoplasmatales archaeon]